MCLRSHDLPIVNRLGCNQSHHERRKIDPEVLRKSQSRTAPLWEAQKILSGFNVSQVKTTQKGKKKSKHCLTGKYNPYSWLFLPAACLGKVLEEGRWTISSRGSEGQFPVCHILQTPPCAQGRQHQHSALLLSSHCCTKSLRISSPCEASEACGYHSHEAHPC